MRSPKRIRPLPRRVVGLGVVANAAQIAARASYVGSPEHKDLPSFAGPPRPRPDASICPQELSEDRALPTQWLRAAIFSGATGGLLEGEFPRYAWHKEGEVVYEARLVNRELGEYKGYPLNVTEWPDGLDSLHD